MKRFNLKNRFSKKRKQLDFASTHSNLVKRNSMIGERISGNYKWILDIGSNRGDTSNYLSSIGHYCVGVEVFEEEWRYSCLHSEPTAAFLNVKVTQEFIKNSPDWGVILLLSVLHRIYAFQGPSEMSKILNACGKKTNEIFIEGSIRHERYTDQNETPPEFKDLDTESADLWHRKLFDHCLGETWRIEHCALLPCSDVEPYRIFYHLKKD